MKVSVALTVLFPALLAGERGEPWNRHTIDGSSRGADGVRLADANGDGLPDIVTGWEQGGVVRVYLNPGSEKSKGKWPAVTVGKAGAVEDAVFVDLDGDGALDVVSACEGRVRRLFVHWAPKEKKRYLDAGAWKTEALPASKDLMAWMFAMPLNIDGKHGIDLIAGGKSRGAAIGWLEAPADARDLAAWRWHPLRRAGWVMSLLAADMDGDGDQDVVASDRRGEGRGCFWLENPGPRQAGSAKWTEHPIGCQQREVMFVALRDLDRDGLIDVLAAVKPREIHFQRRLTADGKSWQSLRIDLPDNCGTSKGVNVADIDLDGKLDVVFTCEAASGGKSGVLWLSYRESPIDRRWNAHDISGRRGVKYDLVELLDLDADGDLDVLTCEESNNLGVIWYENPRQ